jgi:mono/diheme cytochrome c family protein
VIFRCILTPALLVTLISHGLASGPEAELHFVQKVRPLFIEKCLGCHGEDEKKIKGSFDMRTRASFLRGGENVQHPIISGKPDESPLVKAVMRVDDDTAMPPKQSEKLTVEQIEIIKKWIVDGAVWPDEKRIAELTQRATAQSGKWGSADGVTVKTSGGLSPDWTNRKYKPEGLWAYQPVKAVPISDLGLRAGENPIDAFLRAKMPEGIEPAPPCDARTFIRRATFDLTGLPPTPEEVSAFEAAFIQNPKSAIQNLINRLLESPHYGERMAQHWLDVTRYADSSGFANDFERGNAWRYRDYVVRSFNNDKPYDQFVKEQIAGDEIAEERTRADAPEIHPASYTAYPSELLVATGFLRMGPWELTGMEVAKVARQRFLDDVTNSVGETFLAHSLQCARCHDHKFDPVPARDYYSIQAVFATTQLAERAAPFLPVENKAGFEERSYVEKRRIEFQSTLAELDAVMLKNAQRWFQDKGKDAARWNSTVETVQAKLKAPTGKNGQNKRRDFSDVFDSARKVLADAGVPEGDYPPKLVGFTPEQFGMERVARKGLERLKWEMDRYEPFALAVYDGRTPELKGVFQPLRMPENRMSAGELEDSCIHTGGDPFAEGPKVSPGALSVLDALNRKAETRIPQTIEGRRTAFANWVASAENPLTTRAIVNRIWMWHFDQPIAGNPNNFGSTGKKPTHPELLDWLAATFVEKGWSFKAMHRLIMSSAAYQRSATHPDLKTLREKDPLGTSYAVFKPRRLTAEELRDAMLSASGELNPELGGIPNRPEINLEAALQPRQVMGTFASAWVPNPKPEQRNRRSLYALKLRGLSDPAMEVFNAPAPDFSCERREASTVTPQVFALFNSKASLTRALALAARVLKETKGDDEALSRCFALVYGRPAKPQELTACRTNWQEMEALQSKAVMQSTKPPLEVRRDAVEENTGEKFSFTEKLQANADYVPGLQTADCDAHTRALADVCLALLNTNEFAYVY